MAKTPTLPPEDAPAGGKKAPRPTPDAAIRAGVIRLLGSPGDLYEVAVRPLWEGRYRVNVWTGVDAASARVARSYFVAADDAGVILTSTPRIAREFS